MLKCKKVKETTPNHEDDLTIRKKVKETTPNYEDDLSAVSKVNEQSESHLIEVKGAEAQTSTESLIAHENGSMFGSSSILDDILEDSHMATDNLNISDPSEISSYEDVEYEFVKFCRETDRGSILPADTLPAAKEQNTERYKTLTGPNESTLLLTPSDTHTANPEEANNNNSEEEVVKDVNNLQGDLEEDKNKQTDDPYEMVENIADLTVDHVKRHLSIR